jgi:hypothetical protein
VSDRWLSPRPQVSLNNKTDHNDIAEILLKVALEIIKQIGKQTNNATIDKNFVIQLFI